MTGSLMGRLPARNPAAPSDDSLLENDLWISYCEDVWSVCPVKVSFSAGGSDSLSVEASYFLDRRGRIARPPGSPGPYLPLVVHPPADASQAEITNQWHIAGKMLAADMRSRGLAHKIPLPPSITDIVPWMGEGFPVTVLYTYYVDLPHDHSQIRPQVKGHARKAEQAGYTCHRTNRLEDVVECLHETQDRQKFDLHITLDELDILLNTLGEKLLRAYVAYAPDGEPVSASVNIHEPGGPVINWLAGTKSQHLKSGVHQLLTLHLLQDLADHGGTVFDFAGANLPSVATSKQQWGARLTPFYSIDGGTMTELARHVRRYWHFRRSQAGAQDATSDPPTRTGKHMRLRWLAR